MEIKHKGIVLSFDEKQARQVWRALSTILLVLTRDDEDKPTNKQGKPKRKYTRKIHRTRWNAQDRHKLNQLDEQLGHITPLARKIDAIRAHLPNRTPQAIWAQLRREQEVKQTNTTTN